MGSHRDSPEWSRNIHAPWRIPYIRSLSHEQEGCFLCRARDEADQAEENLLLWRTKSCLAVMNKFPYTGGHLMVAPAEHVGSLDAIDGDGMREIMELTADCVKLLTHTVGAEGFNVGINIGRCAGAGLPDHIHVHVVPRWSGDTNFMAVLGDIRLVHESLKQLRGELLQAAKQLKLPRVLHGR